MLLNLLHKYLLHFYFFAGCVPRISTPVNPNQVIIKVKLVVILTQIPSVIRLWRSLIWRLPRFPRIQTILHIQQSFIIKRHLRDLEPILSKKDDRKCQVTRCTLWYQLHGLRHATQRIVGTGELLVPCQEARLADGRVGGHAAGVTGQRGAVRVSADIGGSVELELIGVVSDGLRFGQGAEGFDGGTFVTGGQVGTVEGAVVGEDEEVEGGRLDGDLGGGDLGEGGGGHGQEREEKMHRGGSED